MIYEIDTELGFGRYRKLTIQEVYQGTLQINKYLIRDYLNHILNSKDFIEWGFFEKSEFIEGFDFRDEKIRVIGEILNHDKALGPQNQVFIGNIEKELRGYINQHFQKNFLGILTDISRFNDILKSPIPIGGAPDYLKWCEQNVDDFKLSVKCKNKLSKMSYAKLVGMDIMYIGNETYEYIPKFEVIPYDWS
ncbi:hypothetical protein [Mongoliibacter ruber]|uniref:Uncharacterized protein n=1 Tax=Mongoliibacter ruber TaxID=1750599 RepID=A0A2T0WK81_9BACT|nr:hypothetical protein [Mongoliibacter ruber]PRY87075.1 hypothetical protein CLW00_107144 [Mongoliibacter ruber]